MKKILFLVSAVCLFAVMSVENAFTQGTVDPSLILYLSFDELNNNKVIDHSQYGNHGTLHRAQRTEGKYGKSIRLSGEPGSWIEVPDSPSLDITDEITLMAWVHPMSFTQEWLRIIVKTWAGDTAPWMVYGLYQQGGSNGKVGFILSVDGGQEARCGNGPSPQLPLRTWTHLAATYDGSRMKLYYNGELKVETFTTGKIDTNDIPLSIGRNSEGNREHYAGLIDEVAIWDIALDASEIREAMNGGIAGEPVIAARTTDNFDEPFKGTALQNPNWQWQNVPTRWDVGRTRTDFLHIECEVNRNLWTSDTSHFLYQETTADTFDVESRFFTRSNTSSGVTGLVVKSPADNNWVTIKFSSLSPTNELIQYQTRGNGLAADAGFRPTDGNTELFFRLRKVGNAYTGWYKTRDPDPWIEIGTTHFALTPPLQLGIYAGVATNTGTFVVDYDYFRGRLSTDPGPTSDTPVRTRPVTDVNRDGIVNIQDLIMVASQFGQRGQNDADVNRDGIVDISDLVLVAWAFGQTAAPPFMETKLLENLTVADVRQWLSVASQIRSADIRHQEGILILERLLAVLTPKENLLLSNYPNPFNPETWIPYHLADPADVTLTIYSVDGEVVRHLEVGHQMPGFYRSKARAAYWNGRNTLGEPVSSGIYFYTLTADDFSATKKMLIMK